MNAKSKSAVPAAITLAPNRLELASIARRPAPPIRALIGDTDIQTAYAVQEELNARRIATGAVVVGRKIGLTSPAVQRQLGVDQPDFGVLFADMDVSADPLVPSRRLLQPKAEAEIAFVLKRDLGRQLIQTRLLILCYFPVAMSRFTLNSAHFLQYITYRMTRAEKFKVNFDRFFFIITLQGIFKCAVIVARHILFF